MKKILCIIIALLFLTGCNNSKYVFGHLSPKTTAATTTTVTTTTATIATTTATTVLTTIPVTTVKVAANTVKNAITFSTPIRDYNKNRLGNIKIACNALNGKIIKPGEEFSFNSTVGPRTADKGYKEAIVFYNGEKILELGGGICQVSSTIYNTALKAKFSIVEVHRHGLPVSYVEKGKDATVYYGSKDLRFTNSADKSYKINAYCDGRIVSVSFNPI